MTIIKTSKIKVLFCNLILTAVSYLLFSIIYDYLNYSTIPTRHHHPDYFGLLFTPIYFSLTTLANFMLFYYLIILDRVKIILKPTGIDNQSTINPKLNEFIKWQDIDYFNKDTTAGIIHGVKKNKESFTINLAFASGKVSDNFKTICDYFKKYQKLN